MPAARAGRSMRSTTSGSGIGLAAVVVAIPARAGLLAEAGPSRTARRPRAADARRAGELAELLPDAPGHVEARHVVHGEDAHRHAEVGQHPVHLLRRRPFLDQELRLVHVGQHHPVADEAGAVADDDARPCRAASPAPARRRRVAGAVSRAAHDLDQPHHVRGTEEVQADDGLRTRRGRRRSRRCRASTCWWPGSRRASRTPSSVANTCFFSAMFSNTASITRSASSNAVVADLRR